jgi:tetratricopeptide (TPR) repeat protein
MAKGGVMTEKAVLSIPYVFISYSVDQRPHAEVLADALQAAGVECWLDITSLVIGSDWAQEIERAINKASHVLILVGADAPSRSQELEIRTAISHVASSRIYPILFEDGVLPPTLVDRTYIDLRAASEFEILRAFRLLAVQCREEDRLSEYERAGDKSGLALSYQKLGELAEVSGNYDRALDSYRRSLQMHESLGDVAGVGTIHQQLGSLAQALGDYEEAELHHRRSLEIFEQLGDEAGWRGGTTSLAFLRKIGELMRRRSTSIGSPWTSRSV